MFPGGGGVCVCFHLGNSSNQDQLNLFSKAEGQESALSAAKLQGPS